MTRTEGLTMDVERKPRFPLPLRLGAGIIGLVMVAGAIAGFLDAHADNGGGPFNARQITVLVAFGAIALGLAWVTVNAIRGMIRNPERLAPSQRRAQAILWVSLALGGVIGGIMAVGSIAAPGSSPLHGQMTAPAAIVLSIVAVVVIPGLSWLWVRSIDEHERRGTYVAAETALFAYMTIAPVWWILWRGGLVPQPDQVAIFLTTMFVYTGAWLYRKFA